MKALFLEPVNFFAAFFKVDFKVDLIFFVSIYSKRSQPAPLIRLLSNLIYTQVP